ncbi:MAG TPA: glycosyltransferase family 1 protein [Patescibacteria group bacterium]|jgi:glycosyltransferase involved in cell wall biosynthesis|nr:glycosyltransferase family 1 protein [Patescibacteria group bacterium]
MLIGIEAERANNSVKTGVEHYAKELILELAKIDTKNQYILYLQTKPQAWFLDLPQNFQVKVIPFPIFWTQLRISWEMLWHAPDVLFVPASTLPLIHPCSVYTEHDVAWIYFPEIFTWYMLWFHKVFSWLARTQSTKIISISESTKHDLVNIYKVNPEKIAVVPHGYTQTQDVHNDQLSADVASKLPEKYILFLSTLQPRKNLEKLIDAFRELKNEHPELPQKLVVVGKLGWKHEEIVKKVEANKDIVVFLGHVSDDDRWPIFRKADLYVNPSLYEGFGMPVLEAFECNCPAVVANNSSFPEVGGDAAMYFDPTSKDEIKNALWKVLNNPELRAEMVRKGRVQLQNFSWEKCAHQTLAVLESAGKKQSKNNLTEI